MIMNDDDDDENNNDDEDDIDDFDEDYQHTFSKRCPK